MRKLPLCLLACVIIAIKVSGQDFISDSIRSVYTHAQTDVEKISAMIALGKYKWEKDYTRRSDTAITILNNALIFARQKKLYAQEVEAIDRLGVYYAQINTKRRDVVKARQLLEAGISVARRYQFRSGEINLLVYLSRLTNVTKDSVKLLIDQALNLSRQYQLPEQEVLTLTRLANINEKMARPLIAKTYYLQAVNLARRSRLPQAEAETLFSLAQMYSLNHWSDSAHQTMLEALNIARKSRLTDLELKILAELSASESGFFLKDSINLFYDRVKWLCHTFHRDSLVFMGGFAQSFADMGNFPRALQTYITLLHAYEIRKDNFGIIEALYGIGLAYYSTNDYHRSIAYFSEARRYGSADKFKNIFVHIGLANDYLSLKQKDSTRHYARKAYQLAIDLYGSAATVYGGVLNDLGTIYFELGDDSLSLDYMRSSYIYFTKTEIQYLNYCASTLGLAKCFKRAGMADSSLIYARLCMNTALDKGFLTYLSWSSELVTEYFKNRHNTDSAYYYQQIGFDAYKKLYNDESSREFQNMSFAEEQREKDIAMAEKAAAEQYKSNLRLYALLTVIAVSLLIGFIVFRNNRHKQRSYNLLAKQKQEIDVQKAKLEESLNNLQVTQSQLVQSEKMASLGELTAGIAHEIQNPLNFVNNFSEVNQELVTEMNEEILKGNYEEVKAIAKDITENEQKINHHGKRADAIVKGMLQHSRSSNGVKEPTDINALADEYLRLAYHGLRAKDKSFNANMKTDFDPSIGTVNIVPQDIGRVILNLITNAFYVVDEKKKQTGDGYEPTVSVGTKKNNGKIEIFVKDNGNGISQKVLDKIFQPFFTTKPTGQGTGLGLSLSYDIVKAHGGELRVETKESEGSKFIISIPG